MLCGTLWRLEDRTYSEGRDAAARIVAHLVWGTVYYSDIVVVVSGKVDFDTKIEVCQSVFAQEERKAVAKEMIVPDSDVVEAVVVAANIDESTVAIAGDRLRESLFY